MLSPTAERTIPQHASSEDARLMYLRHIFAYQEAARRLSESRGLVLDLGCGEGYGTDYLSRGTRHVVGVDVDTTTIAYAVQKYGRTGCDYLSYDGRRLPFGDGTFDGVVSCQAIEHVRDDHAFVAEAHRVLAPTGLLIVTTPNRLLRLGPGERPWNRYHVREYAPGDLHALLSRYFARVEVLGIVGDAEVQAHELARLAWVRRTVSRDKFGLRRVLPEWAKQRVLALLRGASSRGGVSSSAASWTPDRYLVTTDAAESLDLFAICGS